MKIDPLASTNALRLVHPPQTVRAVDKATPVEPVTKVFGASGGDSLNFEAVYEANLPKAMVTEALHRLDRIRSQLVAARTEVPIHFDEPVSGGAHGSNGSSPALSSPIARAYLRAAPPAADMHASATEAEVTRLDETA